MHQLGLTHNSCHLMQHHIASDKRIYKFKVGLNASGACLGLEQVQVPQTLWQMDQDNQNNQKNQDPLDSPRDLALHSQSDYRSLHEVKCMLQYDVLNMMISKIIT